MPSVRIYLSRLDLPSRSKVLQWLMPLLACLLPVVGVYVSHFIFYLAVMLTVFPAGILREFFSFFGIGGFFPDDVYVAASFIVLTVGVSLHSHVSRFGWRQWSAAGRGTVMIVLALYSLVEVSANVVCRDGSFFRAYRYDCPLVGSWRVILNAPLKGFPERDIDPY